MVVFTVISTMRASLHVISFNQNDLVYVIRAMFYARKWYVKLNHIYIIFYLLNCFFLYIFYTQIFYLCNWKSSCLLNL